MPQTIYDSAGNAYTRPDGTIDESDMAITRGELITLLGTLGTLGYQATDKSMIFQQKIGGVVIATIEVPAATMTEAAKAWALHLKALDEARRARAQAVREVPQI